MPPRTAAIFLHLCLRLLASACTALATVAFPCIAAPRTASVTICAVGDTLLARGVAKAIARSGPGYPLAKVRSLLTSGDIAVVNLECAISQRPPVLRKRFNFGAPPGSAQVLKQGGITIVNLANNHSMDCGREGLVDTMKALQASGISWFGAGRSMADAERPLIVRVHGMRVGFLGFCRFLPEGMFLANDRPTFATVTHERLRRTISRARRKCDVLVVCAHWGREYDPRPSSEQDALATEMVNTGADVVIGSHPHVLQPLRAVRRGRRRALVAYSLGNFVFDDRGPTAARTGILRITLQRGRGATGARFLPCRIDARRPRPATVSESKLILERLRSLSAEIGTRVDAAGAIR